MNFKTSSSLEFIFKSSILNSLSKSSDFFNKLIILTKVYWIKGPVCPERSMVSLGLKDIFLLGSTFKRKYFSPELPIFLQISKISSWDNSSKKPLSEVKDFASFITELNSSSASTTVPSLDFILPSGGSTIPYERWKQLEAQE